MKRRIDPDVIPSFRFTACFEYRTLSKHNEPNPGDTSDRFGNRPIVCEITVFSWTKVKKSFSKLTFFCYHDRDNRYFHYMSDLVLKVFSTEVF